MRLSVTLAVCKAAAALLFFLTALWGAAVPFLLKRCELGSRIIYLNAFAAGAFLALGVLHIMPEAVNLLDELEVYIHLNGNPYPVTFCLAFIGYLTILFCEGVLCGDSLSHYDVVSEEGRKDGKASCTTKSSHSTDEHDIEGSPYERLVRIVLDAAALDVRGPIEMAVATCEGDCVPRALEDATHTEHPDASGEPECKMESGHFDSTAFFTMLALAVHGLFEGVIVGAARDLSMMWMMSAVVIGHKWAEAMLLMCRLLERKTCVMATALLIVTFACSSPLGVLVGAILATEGKLASGICNALGAGTVFYIASETLLMGNRAAYFLCVFKQIFVVSCGGTAAAAEPLMFYSFESRWICCAVSSNDRGSSLTGGE
ncbi:metal cation zip family protein [Cyclospora cayetanensis]|uniref:Metal cation zip family protein n=1 Tax=Cyclospora cayetanensis TaxID=88456 RepID=A0A1D3D4B4_9EIME|nr:metal cation zip family protein [Cyclospora cayetanensis]